MPAELGEFMPGGLAGRRKQTYHDTPIDIYVNFSRLFRRNGWLFGADCATTAGARIKLVDLKTKAAN
jgi:hypothetical protein